MMRHKGEIKVAFNVLKEVVTHCLYVNDILQRGEHVGSCICCIDFQSIITLAFSGFHMWRLTFHSLN